PEARAIGTPVSAPRDSRVARIELAGLAALRDPYRRRTRLTRVPAPPHLKCQGRYGHHAVAEKGPKPARNRPICLDHRGSRSQTQRTQSVDHGKHEQLGVATLRVAGGRSDAGSVTAQGGIRLAETISDPLHGSRLGREES